jgi:hypothetical protein
MFYVIQDNNILTQDNKDALTRFYDNVQELKNITCEEYQQNIDKYPLIDGILIDISEADEYKDKIAQEQKEIQKAELQSQIDELDKKRIRAVCEMEIKDEASGQTWLEFYTEQIHGLRRQIISL